MESKHQKERYKKRFIGNPFTIYIKGNSITITDIEINNKNEIMIFMASDISSYNDSPIITNNNNNDNYIKTITIKFTITD